MKLNTVLVVDDSLADLEAVSLACACLDCRVEAVSCVEEALTLYSEKKHALVLTDYMMEPMDGVDLIRELREIDPDVNFLIMSGYPDARLNAFRAEIGLPSIITKPIKQANLAEQIRVALHRRLGATEKLSGISLSNHMDQCVPLLGQSPQLCNVRKQIADLLDDNNPIFIEGPFGVGKPCVARFIHNAGTYANSHLVECVCKGASSQELSSKLISEDGVWGSALHEAENGTLVLAHFEEIPLPIQRALAAEMKAISRKCRFIIWANAMLDDLLDEGRIDIELYYFLAFNTIHLPPLSERPVDIEEILRFLSSFPEKFGLERKLASTEIDILVAELRREELPGNLRELQDRMREASRKRPL